MSETQQNAASVIVFDWGDTLMQVFPGASGAMIDWPKMAMVDGIKEALAELKDHAPLYVATNAVASTAQQVWQALDSVGLAEYFRAVFTASELGSRKPRAGFFRQIESVTGHAAREMIMVGDAYDVDVLGAKAVGWRAVWYNPRHETATGLLPLHDIEIANMRDLPQALAQSTLPDVQTSLTWLVERGAHFNILSHVQLGAAAAYQMAVWMTQRGVDVNPLLTHRGGLLHDLSKMDSIRMREGGNGDGDHAAMAHELLSAYGQQELAEIALRHMVPGSVDNPRSPVTWEQKLVNYADKMAEGNRLVTPQERFVALMERYPQFQTELELGQPLLLAMEAEICNALGMTNSELYARLHKSLMGG